jgi:penicillin amidase
VEPYAAPRRPLAAAVWGQRNLLEIKHPLTLAVPALGRWLDHEPTPLPGDWHMPRVQSPSIGASERFAVSPGDEASGYLHMPGGQSGHFLSPFYRAGHEAWVAGRPTGFLPGETRHTLRLAPAG